MSEEKGREAAKDLTEAFGFSYGEAMKSAAEIQQRNIRLAQDWAENLTKVMESQAETNRALTKAMQSYVTVVDEALKSQERTNRALAESLEAYREVVDRAAALQEKNTDLVRNFFEDVNGELQKGMESSQTLARNMMEGSERQMEALQKMMEEAMASYVSLMNAPFELYRKNLESFGGRSE